MSLGVLMPIPEAYGIKKFSGDDDEIEEILSTKNIPSSHKLLIRTVRRNQGASRKYLETMISRSATGKKSSINESLRKDKIQLLALPPVPPQAPWHWFLVKTN